MKKKIFLRIILGIAAFMLLLLLVSRVVVEPWIGKKIQTSLNEKSDDFLIKIEKVHVSILRSGIELENITLQSKSENEEQPDLYGEIESVKFKGIHLVKALFRKDIDIREVDVFNSRFIGNYALQKKNARANVSPVNIRIENLFFDQFFVDLKDTATAQSYFVKDGILKLYDIHVDKQDTISTDVFGQFDLDVPEFKTVTADSLYTFTAVGINYSAASKILTTDSFAMQPNYTEYGFTDQSQFITSRFEGRFSQLSFYDFSAPEFVKSGKMTSSYIEIGEAELHVFRDKRKIDRHIIKPTFQEMFYNYPGTLNIDSIGIIRANIVYSEHAEKSIEKGSISFNEIDAKIYKITNDTIYKTEKAYLELKANALLMGKGKVAVSLKSRLFDNQNTFAVHGTVSEMEASALNPIVEKISFISITTGTINGFNFSFSANNAKATGTLRLLYEGLKFEILNKQTGEATALAEQLKSLIANMIVLESNPIPDEAVRQGIIEYERDPEKFMFNYVVKALMSGLKTSVTKTKSPKKSKK